MAARPFRVAGSLPRPLTVEETAEKFGLSSKVVDVARRVLAKTSVRREMIKKSSSVNRSRGRKTQARKRSVSAERHSG